MVKENKPQNLLQEGTKKHVHQDTPSDDIAIEAAVFRRLLKHLDDRKAVQNIDLMNLADFCRNCLAKWYMAEAQARDKPLAYEQARELIYGMPYGEWKKQFQAPATPEQLALFEKKQAAKKDEVQ